MAVNRALFTSFSVLLANADDLHIDWLRGQRKNAIRLLGDLLTYHPEYYNAVTSSTSSHGHMMIQFWGAKTLLEELVG